MVQQIRELGGNSSFWRIAQAVINTSAAKPQMIKNLRYTLLSLYHGNAGKHKRKHSFPCCDKTKQKDKTETQINVTRYATTFPSFSRGSIPIPKGSIGEVFLWLVLQWVLIAPVYEPLGLNLLFDLPCQR